MHEAVRAGKHTVGSEARLGVYAPTGRRKLNKGSMAIWRPES
jgi:hypothetical protein